MMFEKQRKSSMEKVQDPSLGDTANPSSDLGHSANKDSDAAVDQNRTGDKPGTAELGENSANLGVKHKFAETDSDSQAAANDGSEISQEKHHKLHDS
uniref:Uncharacterized protein n=1 Tax=Arundo donax TaxID=35708 RepID=A0A0A9GUG6_ARUDO